MGSSLTSCEKFVQMVVYIAFILFALMMIGIGGLLTIIATGIALVGYYPIRGWNWMLSTLLNTSTKLVDKFTKGNI